MSAIDDIPCEKCGSKKVRHAIAINEFGLMCILGAHATFEFNCQDCGHQWCQSDRQAINWQIPHKIK